MGLPSPPSPRTRITWASFVGFITGHCTCYSEFQAYPLARISRQFLSGLHVNDNTTAVPRGEEGYDRLCKLRPLIEKLRDTWRTCYNPPREQSIDKAMVGFKGRNAVKQYMPMKSTKHGYKVGCHCSSNGFLSECKIYSSGSLAQTRETNLSILIVLKLTGFIANKGHHLFYEN